MKKYLIEIKSKNRMFSVRGVLVRTPATWIADENEIENIRLKITSEGIEKFNIEEYDPNKAKEEKPKAVEDTITDVVDEPKPEPTSTLEKLMVD